MKELERLIEEKIKSLELWETTSLTGTDQIQNLKLKYTIWVRNFCK